MEPLSPILFTSGYHSSVVQCSLQSDYGGDESWTFIDFVLHRLVPLWVSTRELEFTWDYILQGLEANTNLVRYFS
ncbi:hypothetical protein AHAS_Ahas02G0174800 [Arachis hypogaea]